MSPLLLALTGHGGRNLMSMLKEQVVKVLDEVLEQHPSFFLIDLYVGTDNHIRIVMDGDEGINLQDCMTISRAVEGELDRDEIDFSLEVTSAGATAPLVKERQYRKNIGRKLEVKTADEKLEGTLTAVSDEAITLEWKAREPKPVGKGKHTVEKKQQVAFSDIEEAKVKLTF